MKLKVGEIDTKKLLDYFGTDKQIFNYKRDKKLNSTAKTRILTKASKFCEIEDVGQGKFIIHKVSNID